MKNVFSNLFSSLPAGMRIFLLCYALGFPVLMLGHLSHTFALEDWLALSPALVWKGQVWRVLTYAFLAGGILGWVVNLFWFVTLISILGRNWSSVAFWFFCLFAAIAGALPIVLLMPGTDARVLSGGGIIFALLVAWDRLYHRERLIMLGIGEMSVRQAAIFVAVINAVIVFFSCGGWLLTLSMMCGGLAGWIYLALGSKRLLSRSSQTVESERIARLEL
jgi:membrane associated rhomboid family serine protease